jgi:ABC-type branched-subunit amino acid transport system substrate-binding protein
MRGVHHIRRLRPLLGSVLALTLLAAACGNSGNDTSSKTTTTEKTATTTGGSSTPITGVPGVTADEIRFSSFGTISQNPLGTCVLECFDQGVKAYFEYRNSKGGVDGRKLVLSKELDDQLSKNKDAALEITSANDTFASFSAAQISDGWSTIAAAGMPLYVWNINPADAAHDGIYGSPQNTICLSCPRQINGEIVKIEKAKKIGILGYGVSDNSKLAAQATRDAIEKYSSDIGGAKVVYFNDGIPFGVPNGLGPEVTAMKTAGVDLVFGTLDLNAMKTLAQEMSRQGMGNVHMVHANTYDQKFVQEGADLFEGDIVTLNARPFEAPTNESDLQLFKDWMKKTGHDPVELALYGWISARTAYDGIVAAGADFDRAKVISASNAKLNDYTAGGLIPPQDYGKHALATADNLAQTYPKLSCTALLRVKSGKFVLIGNPDKPFYCWPGDSLDWSAPQQLDFK